MDSLRESSPPYARETISSKNTWDKVLERTLSQFRIWKVLQYSRRGMWKVKRVGGLPYRFTFIQTPVQVQAGLSVLYWDVCLLCQVQSPHYSWLPLLSLLTLATYSRLKFFSSTQSSAPAVCSRNPIQQLNLAGEVRESGWHSHSLVRMNMEGDKNEQSAKEDSLNWQLTFELAC